MRIGGINSHAELSVCYWEVWVSVEATLVFHRAVLEPSVVFFLVSPFLPCIYPLPQKLVGEIVLPFFISLFLLYLFINQHAIHLNILVHSLGRLNIIFSLKYLSI